MLVSNDPPADMSVLMLAQLLSELAASVPLSENGATRLLHDITQYLRK